MAKEIWVKNTGATTIKVKAVIKAATETSEEVSKEVSFSRYKVNAQSGFVESNGFTPVEADVFKALLEKKVFKDLIDQQVLIKYDEQPDEAVTPAARLQMLSAQVGTLQDTVTALTAENEALKKGGADKALKKDLEAANARIVELETELEAANKKLAEGEFDAGTSNGAGA